MGTEIKELEARLNRLEAGILKPIPTLLSETDMMELLRCSRSFLYELIAVGMMPKAYKLGEKKKLWKGVEVAIAIEKSLKPIEYAK